jgi:hypothetical protein
MMADPIAHMVVFGVGEILSPSSPGLAQGLLKERFRKVQERAQMGDPAPNAMDRAHTSQTVGTASPGDPHKKVFRHIVRLMTE